MSVAGRSIAEIERSVSALNAHLDRLVQQMSQDMKLEGEIRPQTVSSEVTSMRWILDDLVR